MPEVQEAVKEELYEGKYLRKPTVEDYQNAEKAARWTRLGKLPYEERVRFAQQYGADWVGIVSKTPSFRRK